MTTTNTIMIRRTCALCSLRWHVEHGDHPQVCPVCIAEDTLEASEAGAPRLEPMRIAS